MGCGSSSTTGSNPGSASGGVVLAFFAPLRGGARGNATRFLLSYCNVPYTEKGFPMSDGMKQWREFKGATNDIPFLDLPYLTDGSVKITQTLAI